MRTRRYFALGTCVLGLAVAATLGGPPQSAGQKPAPMMTKPSAAPNFQATARMIVNEAVQVKENEGVLITGDATKIPLMEAIAVEVAKKGGFPHLVLESPEVAKRVLTECSPTYLSTPNQMTIAEIKHTNVQISLSSVEDPTYLAKVPEERVALVRKASQAVTEALYSRPMRTVSLGNPMMPSAGIARFYGVPLADMEARFWEAVNTPPATIAENGRKVKEALASGREIHIQTQAGTDLRFKLAGRKVTLADGQIHNPPVDKPEQVWLPAGEVFTAPDASTVNGTVFVPLAEYRGNKIKDLKLTFQGGKVTKIEAAQNAEVLKEALAKSAGDKDLFSFIDIGVNPNSRMMKSSDYCTYEMGGMVTMGIGQAPWLDCPNQSDFAQEFFIPRATVEVDGRVIVRDGTIQI